MSELHPDLAALAITREMWERLAPAEIILNVSRAAASTAPIPKHVRFRLRTAFQLFPCPGVVSVFSLPARGPGTANRPSALARPQADGSPC